MNTVRMTSSTPLKLGAAIDLVGKVTGISTDEETINSQYLITLQVEMKEKPRGMLDVIGDMDSSGNLPLKTRAMLADGR